MSKNILPVLKIDYILNAPILTNWGCYEYKLYDPTSIGLDLSESVSAVGHASTANLLSHVLHYPVEINRVEPRMEVGETALVFSLKHRQSEGKILRFEELEKIGFDLGILKRIT